MKMTFGSNLAAETLFDTLEGLVAAINETDVVVLDTTRDGLNVVPWEDGVGYDREADPTHVSWDDIRWIHIY